jgi:peptide chain release factor 2
MDTPYAEERGIKSATFEIDAPYAFGTLSVEAGTTPPGADVARSEPRASAQTSFAAVEVIPLMEETEAIEIPENDIGWTCSGRRPGGQSGQHTPIRRCASPTLPTGTVVFDCMNEKSQIQNRAAANAGARIPGCSSFRRSRRRRPRMELAGTITASWGDQDAVVRARRRTRWSRNLRTDYEC